MAVPAEKLNMMLEELMNESRESAQEMNVISLDEYKKLNADKIAYLDFLKKMVTFFNKKGNDYKKGLAMIEMIYLLTIQLSISNTFGDKEKEKHNKFLNEVNEVNKRIFVLNTILNGIKNYPNPRLKKNVLKINNEIYKDFLRARDRITQILQEIEESNFAPQEYMEDALRNVESLMEKYEYYKDSPESFLSFIEYYYSTDDELEWTNEDREQAVRYYA